MIRLFISYRSTNSIHVDAIVAQLESLIDTDNQPRYNVWQDKNNIPVGQDWWDAICEGIEKCDIFIFMVSHESIKSEPCLAELSYADELNLPIIPFVIKDEGIQNEETGKWDIDFWDELPPQLLDGDFRRQFLFYEGVALYIRKLKVGIKKILEAPPSRLPADRPLHPGLTAGQSKDPDKIFQTAIELVKSGQFEAAKRLFRQLIERTEHSDDAFMWIKIIKDYSKIQNQASHPTT
jgi:hypothetical protein